MIESIKYMKRALQLAAYGAGSVSPNPMVGCVIVKDNLIIGEGWHKTYGEPHAEVNAIESVRNKEDLQGADVYVTLEPCSHFGKTPPCADLLSSYKFKKVYICNVDTNPLVGGKGINKLNQAGIPTEVGLLSEYGRALNKRFFTFIEKNRPFVILKWAETSDGFIARKDYSSKWITNEFSRKLVHKWRSEETAIMVGTNTVIYDNPTLTVRDWHGKSPIRVILDKKLQLISSLNVFDKSVPTLIYNTKKNSVEHNLEYVLVDEAKILNQILADLHKRNISSLLVEGGSSLLQSFINEGLWDEARIFKSLEIFKDGIASPKLHGKLISTDFILNDQLMVYSRL